MCTVSCTCKLLHGLFLLESIVFVAVCHSCLENVISKADVLCELIGTSEQISPLFELMPPRWQPLSPQLHQAGVATGVSHTTCAVVTCEFIKLFQPSSMSIWINFISARGNLPALWHLWVAPCKLCLHAAALHGLHAACKKCLNHPVCT